VVDFRKTIGGPGGVQMSMRPVAGVSRPAIAFRAADVSLFAVCRRTAEHASRPAFAATLQRVTTTYDLVQLPHDEHAARVSIEAAVESLVTYTATEMYATASPDLLVLAMAIFGVGQILRMTNTRDTAVVTPLFQAMGNFTAFLDGFLPVQDGGTLFEQDRLFEGIVFLLKANVDRTEITRAQSDGITHVMQRLGLLSASQRWSVRVEVPNVWAAIDCMYPQIDEDVVRETTFRAPASYFDAVREWDTSPDAALNYAIVYYLEHSAADACRTGADVRDPRLAALRTTLSADDADTNVATTLVHVLADSLMDPDVSFSRPDVAAFLRQARRIEQ